MVTAFLNHTLLFTDLKWGRNVRVFIRFWGYLPWLFWEIVLASIYVAKVVLHPRMPIEPRIIEFDTKLKENLSMVTLGNSITVTPGTITVDIRDGRFLVHALTQEVANELLSGKMENRVAAVHGEGADRKEKERD